MLLGPIALLLALVEVRNERPWWTRLVASGDPGRGPVDVLVGIDGSPESAASTTAALELLGDRVGRLTLVAVTDLDGSYAGREEREARNRMRRFLMIFLPIIWGLLGVVVKSPLQMVSLGGILNALYLMAVSVATIYLSYRQTGRRRKDGHLFTVYLLVFAVAVFATGTISLFDIF